MEDRTEFLRESEIMLDLNHPNLLRLVGVAVQQRPWLSVLEYMEVSPAVRREVPLCVWLVVVVTEWFA